MGLYVEPKGTRRSHLCPSHLETYGASFRHRPSTSLLGPLRQGLRPPPLTTAFDGSFPPAFPDFKGPLPTAFGGTLRDASAPLVLLPAGAIAYDEVNCLSSP